MKQDERFELACSLQAKNFHAASTFGLCCNRAIYEAVKNASEETPDAFIGQVVPAGTGTGKTTFTLSLIAASVLSDPKYSAAFVTPTIEAAQNAYDALRKMLPEKAIAIHTSAHAKASASNERGEDIKLHFEANGPSSQATLVNARVAICTHEAWLREGLSDSSHGIRYHSSGQRTNVFVDELPDAVRVNDVSASDLVELANEFERHQDTRPLAPVVNEFALGPDGKKDGKCSRFWLVKALTQHDAGAINSFDASKLATAASPERCRAALSTLKRATDGNAFWTRTGPTNDGGALGHKRLVAYSNILRAHVGLVILDATARYALGTSKLNKVAVPTVRYPQLNACHIEPPAFLKGASVTKLKTADLGKYAKWIARVVREHLDTAEQSLLVMHQRVEELVRKELQKDTEVHRRVLMTHWGCDVGSNKYRDCKTAFLFAEFCLPRHVYLAKALGGKGRRATEFTLKQATGQRSTGSVFDVEDAHLLRQFKQMACRGTARHIDDDGNAAPMRIITSMDRARLLKCLPDLFPGAPTPDILPSPSAAKPTKGKLLASYLLGKTVKGLAFSLCATEVRDNTGIEPKDLARVFRSRECEILEAFGWTFVPGAGRRSKPHLMYSSPVASKEVMACAA